ncbi:hypothetical protein [Nitrosopumilus sp.]|uniref:hypothetical protein n=1 Tax=Nitrosopumilus sp. TaxID=2024843 RepID=UPI00292CA7E2|nr:hypothetical protein [Nitrosopumilus sp.]
MTVIIFPEEIEFSDIESYSVIDFGGYDKKPFGDVSAEEYFEFAKKAHQREGKDGYVDALGNAKRCFHYQIDRLLYRYSLHSVMKKKEFPRKVQLLSELNIIPSTLLRTFNTERNAMEHDYSTPSKEIVEGAIDLCDLLFLATERFLERTPLRIRIKFKKDDRDLILFLESGSNKIRKFQVLGSELESSKNGKFYSTRIFQVGSSDELQKGISIIHLREDVEISLGNKKDWFVLLKIFSYTARYGREGSHDENRIMATILHQVPYRSVIDFMNSRPQK